MSSTATIRLTRDQVEKRLTWDLSILFSDNQAWSSAAENIKGELTAIEAYQGRIAEGGQTLADCLLMFEKTYIKYIQLATYVSLKQSEDGTNPENQARSMQFSGIATTVDVAFTFIASELLALDQATYAGLFACAALLPFKRYLDDLYEDKPYRLSPETEKVLAELGELMGAPYRIYGMSKAADMAFAEFTGEADQSLPNSFALFESNYEFSRFTTIRRNAYASFVQTLQRYKNTYAAVYAAEVRKQVALSRARGYPSVTHMLLKPQKVTVEMYNQQIDLIYRQLAPHMQRLAKLKRKQLGLDELRFCDLKAPLDPDFAPPATIPEIQGILQEALSVLGPDYQAIIKRAFAERWIDFVDNVGKSTGAFCASPYGAHSFVLITYQPTMRSAFTLAHELGHAGHFTLANAQQRVFDTRPSTYFVEAPSTINEMFLAGYFMKRKTEPRFKRWVILQLLETYYHNFVTHLLEAEYQRRVYAMAEKNQPLTAKALCETTLQVLRGFWGDTVKIDDDAGLTWMRQPHYFMGLYPYTYSAGLSAATAISRRVMKEGQAAADQWLAVLQAGGSLTPEELLRKAGLDTTGGKFIQEAVDHVGGLITELESLFD
ncbi:MAG: oligoendopeptidase F [Spirochaetes bacterium GWD1_61_31]|nr:MAG: oligoendopeptidase F [Spirochaetes bacterium GWB1_60_80]OHD34203.1 MAG: oligoendopeptidase F [Spirochaetes bacterium GWC1_61_12]OHD40131.1 MAG: oligoendopeptidase F [Spirochaetes bacterium GWD1_61_31]OHD45821.1 MAG: oligoendopeptidase F [Spirochaetes bacterium GWE1_60_18]OHD58364.1 MAG: oligoendopeptidase F [Spirochaetes bacterium GWF1_60_12]HAW86363.1 oligoendopeptidase F [Spirochaetaceae bacterium]